MSWLALLAILLIMAGIPAVVLCPAEHRWRWGGGVIALLVVMVTCAALDEDARKTVQFCLMPTGVAWLLVGGLATAAFMSRYQRLGVLLSLAFLLLTVGGSQWLGGLLISDLERRITLPDSGDGERYDVVCVLGGGTNRRFDGVEQLGPTGDRLRVGMLLQRQQRTTLLLTTGVFAPDTRRMWEQLGVPGDQILEQPEPGNTAQEIAVIKRLADERGWKRIGVVSSAWHLPRVARLAAKQGLAVLPLPCNWMGTAQPWTADLLVPKADGARLVETGIKEHLGVLLGR